MKVLQINAVYGHSSTGTIVRDIEQLCFQNGIECYVASPDKAVLKAKNGYVIGNVFDHKIHALLGRINGRQAYFSHIPTWNLLKWIDKVQPDIVHLHNLHSNYIHLNMLLTYLAKKDIRTIITFHDCWLFTGGCFHFASVACDKWQTGCGNCPKKLTDTPAYLMDFSASILRDRERYLNAIPRLTIVGASEWVANECRKSVLKNRDIRFIHNGFDLDIFKPVETDLRQKYGLEGKYVILGPSGKWNLDVNKATYDYFVEHMDKDMVLVLFGGDTNRQTPENVLEIGYVKGQKQMAEVYSMADVFVNCTREDTLPGVNLECQACGTPIVTYDATGCKETVDGVCGRAVKTGEYEELFKVMREVRNSGKASLSTACIEWISTNFEIQAAYRKYIELFYSVSI